MTSQSLSASLAAQSLPAEGLYLQLELDRLLPALLPAPQLVEIMTVAIAQVVPMFHLPPWVMGVYNWRGEVLWLVDLNHLLGLTPWYEQTDYGSRHTVIVLREASQSKEKAIVGLVVNQVEEMVKCTADCLHPLPELNDSPDSLSDSPSDSLANSFSGVQFATLPAHLHRFFVGYWQNEIPPRYWLLDPAAIFQNLSETSF